MSTILVRYMVVLLGTFAFLMLILLTLVAWIAGGAPLASVPPQIRPELFRNVRNVHLRNPRHVAVVHHVARVRREARMRVTPLRVAATGAGVTELPVSS